MINENAPPGEVISQVTQMMATHVSQLTVPDDVSGLKQRLLKAYITVERVMWEDEGKAKVEALKKWKAFSEPLVATLKAAIEQNPELLNDLQKSEHAQILADFLGAKIASLEGKTLAALKKEWQTVSSQLTNALSLETNEQLAQLNQVKVLAQKTQQAHLLSDLTDHIKAILSPLHNLLANSLSKQELALMLCAVEISEIINQPIDIKKQVLEKISLFSDEEIITGKASMEIALLEAFLKQKMVISKTKVQPAASKVAPEAVRHQPETVQDQSEVVPEPSAVVPEQPEVFGEQSEVVHQQSEANRQQSEAVRDRPVVPHQSEPVSHQPVAQPATSSVNEQKSLTQLNNEVTHHLYDIALGQHNTDDYVEYYKALHKVEHYCLLLCDSMPEAFGMISEHQAAYEVKRMHYCHYVGVALHAAHEISNPDLRADALMHIQHSVNIAKDSIYLSTPLTTDLPEEATPEALREDVITLITTLVNEEIEQFPTKE